MTIPSLCLLPNAQVPNGSPRSTLSYLLFTLGIIGAPNQEHTVPGIRTSFVQIFAPGSKAAGSWAPKVLYRMTWETPWENAPIPF